MQPINAYMNWSGGKDSAMTLHRMLLSDAYHITHLLTSMNAVHQRVSMHGVRRRLLQQQAASIGLPLHTLELGEQPGMSEYEQCMFEAVKELKSRGCTHAVFGDIFLEDLRQYRENKLRNLDVSCVFPLWKQNTTELLNSFVTAGFQAIIVCVDERHLDRSFCGRLIDESLLQELPSGVDPCGENGEYHSFVFDGPIFRDPVPFAKGEIVYRQHPAPSANNSCNTGDNAPTSGFYFCDLIPTNS